MLNIWVHIIDIIISYFGLVFMYLTASRYLISILGDLDLDLDLDLNFKKNN
jgi:hypothetical protein